MMQRLCLSAMLALATSGTATADNLEMCLDQSGTTDAQCACAAEKLTAEIGAEEVALYDAVGTRYLVARAGGQGMGEAWDAAIAETAQEAGMGRTPLLERMNAAGQAHSAAIRSCG